MKKVSTASAKKQGKPKMVSDYSKKDSLKSFKTVSEYKKMKKY